MVQKLLNMMVLCNLQSFGAIRNEISLGHQKKELSAQQMWPASTFEKGTALRLDGSRSKSSTFSLLKSQLFGPLCMTNQTAY